MTVDIEHLLAAMVVGAVRSTNGHKPPEIEGSGK